MDKMKIDLTNKNSFTVNGKVYIIDIDKFKEICFVSKNNMLTDSEITDVSSIDDEETDFVNQKVIRETKYCDTQSDVIMQDLIKTFLLRVIDIVDFEEITLGDAICFNTCLEYGIIKEK